MARTRHRFSLPLGKLIGTSLSVYGRNVVPFTLMCALILSPWILFRIFVRAGRGDFDILLVGTLLSVLLSYILTGALTFGVVQHMRGQPAGMATALTRGFESFFRVLGTGLLAGLRIVLFSLLLWIPGIIESMRLFVAIPIAAIEGKGASASIERSIRLTDGSRWQVFGAYIVINVVLAMGLTFVTTFAIMIYMGPFDTLWIELGVAMLTTPLYATVMSVAYFLLRQGKENVAAAEIAAVFD